MSFFNTEKYVKEGDVLILYESMDNLKLIKVDSTHTYSNKFGVFPHGLFLGKEFGSKVKMENLYIVRYFQKI
jgi:tRNA A58 N-methylase Trm61